MSPIVTFLTALLAAPKVKAALAGLTKEAAKAGKDVLIRRLQPTAREQAAKKAIELFAEEWIVEMETWAMEMAYEGYRDQLHTLIEYTAVEIAEWMSPETKDVDLSLIVSVWNELHLDPLPEDFSWTRVGQNYARAITVYIRRDPTLRAEYDTALQEKMLDEARRAADAAERAAGLDPGFDVEAYRRFLIENKCNFLQLAALHTSTYDHDRKLILWSVFVEPSARESIPFVDTPPEILRQMRLEGHLTESPEARDLSKLREKYQSSPVSPVFEILNRERLVVVTGDPGSGKTSLMKYRALQWANANEGLPLPFLIDLKEYARFRGDLFEYCQSAKEVFRFGASHVDRLLNAGEAGFYLDGLDEVFEAQTRSKIIEEIAILSTRYPQARFVVTSRKIGYDPERLRAAGFLHATIEDFEQRQMFDFLHRWHALAEPVESERSLQVARMERAITESQPIRELAGNPLLLTMMAILNRNQELPRNRVALYREASRVLLDDWDARKTLPVSEFDREDKEALLRELAGEMQQSMGGLAGNLIDRKPLLRQFESFLESQKTTDSRIKARALVAQLSERNFILAPAGADRFCFVHRTFLEYFCAAWFVERLHVKREITFEHLRDDVFGRHWKDEKWHEVLRLIAGMVSAEDAGRIIDFLMQQDGSKDGLANLMLAAGCLYEVRNRKAIAATDEALWQRLTTDAIRFEVKNKSGALYRETLWMPATEAAVQTASVRWIAQAWREQNALSWLRKMAAQDDNETIRLAAMKELVGGWSRDAEMLALLRNCTLNDESWIVRLEALKEITSGWKEDEETLSLLKMIAANDLDNDVFRTAVEEILKAIPGDMDVWAILRRRAVKASPTIMWTAIQALAFGWTEREDTVSLLKQLTSPEFDINVRSTAILELGRHWPHDPAHLPFWRTITRAEKDLHAFQTIGTAIVEYLPADDEILQILKDRATNDTDARIRGLAVGILTQRWHDDPEVVVLIYQERESAPSDEEIEDSINSMEE